MSFIRILYMKQVSFIFLPYNKQTKTYTLLYVCYPCINIYRVIQICVNINKVTHSQGWDGVDQECVLGSQPGRVTAWFGPTTYIYNKANIIYPVSLHLNISHPINIILATGRDCSLSLTIQAQKKTNLFIREIYVWCGVVLVVADPNHDTLSFF